MHNMKSVKLNVIIHLKLGKGLLPVNNFGKILFPWVTQLLQMLTHFFRNHE